MKIVERVIVIVLIFAVGWMWWHWPTGQNLQGLPKQNEASITQTLDEQSSEDAIGVATKEKLIVVTNNAKKELNLKSNQQPLVIQGPRKVMRPMEMQLAPHH